MTDFSDYIVYVDESGDARLTGYDSNYPVFVLAFCIFHKKYYTKNVVKEVQSLKFKHFGHDMIVLHERDILKNQGQFVMSKTAQSELINDITGIMERTQFIVVACVIDKAKLIQQYSEPYNPYHLAIQFGLERIYQFLQEKNQTQKITHIVFEQRGKKEDKEVFEQYCRSNIHRTGYPFKLIMASKHVNSTGMQFADLIARPIGTHILHPTQENRAFDIIKHKLYCKGGRDKTGQGYMGFGLKKFP